MIPLTQTAVCRFLVSTVFTSDCGWETAVLGRGSVTGTATPVPVARYENLEEAKRGHKTWVDKIMSLGPQALPVVRLGWGDLVEEQLQVLDPMRLEEYKQAVKSIAPDFE